MPTHLQRQINQLKKMLLGLGAQVEEAVVSAIQAVEDRDVDRARQVIEGDADIDLTEVDIEEDCLQTLALYQPVAFDLRYVVAVLKINNELERIGDLACNIAEQAIFLSRLSAFQGGPLNLQAMADHVRTMVGQSLDALVNLDLDMAEAVRKRDDQVDAIHREMYRNVEQLIRSDPEMVQAYIHMLSVSRNLERMADHAVNIAEDVIYMARGTIERHRRNEISLRETTE